jgi:hypothetical protein
LDLELRIDCNTHGVSQMTDMFQIPAPSSEGDTLAPNEGSKKTQVILELDPKQYLDK